MTHQTFTRIRIKSPSDFGAGLLLSGCSALFLYLGKDLERGTAFQMGPGFFPTAIAVLALIVGLALIAKSLSAVGPATEPFRLAPALLVIAAIASFALLVGKLGLIVSGTITMLLASMATAQQGWMRVIVVSVVVSVFSGLLFVVALGLSIPLWPTF
jgi:hypothetical protein